MKVSNALNLTTTFFATQNLTLQLNIFNRKHFLVLKFDSFVSGYVLSLPLAPKSADGGYVS